MKTFERFSRSYLSSLSAGVRPVFRLRPDRLWEGDTCRGIAICMMVIYHLAWDLRAFGVYDVPLYSAFWVVWQKTTAGLFTVLVGVSLTLSYSRARQAADATSLWPKYLGRGAAIFTWGMVITAATLLVLGPEQYIRFGILHLIGVATVVAYPLLRFRWLNLALAAVLVGLGALVRGAALDIPWLQWLAPTPGAGVDYTPLVPMLSRVLLGIFVGNMLYPGGRRGYRLQSRADHFLARVLQGMGQNSLLIYLFHQPVLVGILLLAV